MNVWVVRKMEKKSKEKGEAEKTRQEEEEEEEERKKNKEKKDGGESNSEGSSTRASASARQRFLQRSSRESPKSQVNESLLNHNELHHLDTNTVSLSSLITFVWGCVYQNMRESKEMVGV
ncbi:hypothetical protein YC2023_028839 [Brassica napus]